MADFGNNKFSHGGEPSNQFAAISADTGPTAANPLAGRTYTATGVADTLISDTVDLVDFALIRSMYIGVAGNIKMLDHDGQILGPIAVPIGVLPLRPRRIFATLTTATQIVLLR
jgi:hypothetical protein